MTDRAWKHLAPRSERQIGASIWADLLLHKRVGEPAKDAAARETFRNRVIHQGEFPTRDEALSFAQDLFKFARARDAELRSTRADARSAVLNAMWLRAADRLSKDGHTGSIAGQDYATVLSGAASDFDDALRKFRELNPFARWHEDITVAEVAARLKIPVDALLMKWLLPTFFEQSSEPPVFPEVDLTEEPPPSS